MDIGKERMLDDWMAVRNAILRADSGEMKVTYLRPEDNKDNVIGVAVDLELRFPKPLPQEMAEKEKEAIKAAREEIDKKLKE